MFIKINLAPFGFYKQPNGAYQIREEVTGWEVDCFWFFTEQETSCGFNKMDASYYTFIPDCYLDALLEFY